MRLQHLSFSYVKFEHYISGIGIRPEAPNSQYFKPIDASNKTLKIKRLHKKLA